MSTTATESAKTQIHASAETQIGDVSCVCCQSWSCCPTWWSRARSPKGSASPGHFEAKISKVATKTITESSSPDSGRRSSFTAIEEKTDTIVKAHKVAQKHA